MDIETANQILELALGDYAGIRQEYRMRVYSSILDYLRQDNVPVTKFRNVMKRAIADNFIAAGELGYTDGGGELPEPEDFMSWIGARQEEEFGYTNSLYSNLKGLKKEEDFDPFAEASTRAEGYAKTLDGIYNEAKIRGAKNKMLTFGGTDGEHTCSTCQRLQGARHRASWWINHDLVPGPVNKNYECGGFRCQHYLYDDDGKLFTI